MTTIDPRSGIAAALQARLAAAAATRKHAPAPPSGTRNEAAATAARPGMAERIRAIAADDPQRRSRAVRIFLEAELLQAFGGELLNDPQFAVMVDAVHRQMREDPQLARASEALADLLLAGQAG